MKPLKNLLLLLVIAILLLPFTSSANVAESGLACATKSENGLKLRLFSAAKSNIYEDFHKKMSKKRKLSKAHRKSLLKKAKKSKAK